MRTMFRMGLTAGLILAGLAVSDARAQQPAAPATPSGWAGYAPASAWVGYAPASAVNSPTIVANTNTVRPLTFPNNGSRRHNSGHFVNELKPQYASTLPSYLEYGSGRHTPVAKPWIPLPP